MDRMFLNDKYRYMYDLPYNNFIVQLIKLEDNVVDESNIAISDYISKIGNQEDVIGIHSWINKLSEDEINIDRTSLTLEIRNKVQTLFCGKLVELMNKGYLNKTVIPHRVIEAAFFKVSANIYIDVIERLAEQSDKGNNQPKRIQVRGGKVQNDTDIQREVSSKVLSKPMAYGLAFIACVILLFAYTALGSLAFGWKHGGGFIPLAILGACEIALWKWIVGKAKKKK